MSESEKEWDLQLELEKAKGKRWCINCGWNVYITSGPAPSGEHDGVYCSCPELMEELQDAVIYDEDFGEVLYLFRGEVCGENFDCKYWKRGILEERDRR